MRKILLLISAVIISTSAWSQNLESRSIRQSVYTTDYTLYPPTNYDPAEIKDYPLIIFLHGAGERGLPPSEVGVHLMFAKAKYWPQHEAFVAVPVCHKDVNWEPLVLNQMLKEILATCRIDQDRIYLTGLSMGGYGTWKWASQNPELFAAAAPVCGGGDPEKVWGMRNMPVWASHGEDDDIVPCSESVKMVDALKALGSNPKFDIYPGIKHNAWDKTYYNPEFYDWLFSQKRKPMPSIEIPAADIDKYVGTYKVDDQVVVIEKIDGKLKLENMSWGRKVDLLSDAPERFYIPDIGNNMIMFKKSPSGEIEALIVYANEKPITGKKIK